MKIALLIFLCLLSIHAWPGQNQDLKRRELDLRERELAIKERELDMKAKEAREAEFKARHPSPTPEPETAMQRWLRSPTTHSKALDCATVYAQQNDPKCGAPQKIKIVPNQ